MNFISGLLDKYKKRRDDEYANAIDSMTRWSTFMTDTLNTEQRKNRKNMRNPTL